MLPAELTGYLDFARQLVRTASDAILPHFRVPIDIENKGKYQVTAEVVRGEKPLFDKKPDKKSA